MTERNLALQVLSLCSQQVKANDSTNENGGNTNHSKYLLSKHFNRSFS
jgi:hypothetical protein